MKSKYLFIFGLFFFTQTLTAQDYLTTLTAEVCDCMTKDESPMTNQTEINEVLVKCMIQIATLKMTEIKEELGIDITQGEEEGRKLGEQIGAKLAMECPKMQDLIGVIAKQTVEEETASQMATQSIHVTFEKVETDQFATVYGKDKDTGRTMKFLWLTYFLNSEQLMDGGKALVGKTLNIEFTGVELYSPKLGDYTIFKQITNMTVVE